MSNGLMKYWKLKWHWRWIIMLMQIYNEKLKYRKKYVLCKCWILSRKKKHNSRQWLYSSQKVVKKVEMRRAEMPDLTICLFLSEYSYNLNESSCVDAVVLVYSCFSFHSERICDTCKIVHPWKCAWVTLAKPEKEFSSRAEGNGERKV